MPSLPERQAPLSNAANADAFLAASREAQLALSQFVGTGWGEFECISLGQNCSSAWYLKQAGLKKASYPFDWVFTSPEIVEDCLADNFGKFLDQSLIKEKQDGKGAGHAVYHGNFFNHRSPLRSPDDYDYYARCCDRFLRKINSNEGILFLMTLVNEPEKRVGWANGFDQQFSMPVAQTVDSVKNLMAALTSKHRNCKFLIIDHYTRQKPSINFKQFDDSLFFVTFCAIGRSNGVRYVNELDDSCYRRIFSGLSQNNNP